MYNFCTLFDSNYLAKGLTLYKSLSNVCDEFHLYVVAFDDDCYIVLKNLYLQNLTVVSLKEFETEELLSVKSTRNRAEYCWTCGPSVIYHFIKYYHLDHCAYLDADMMFFSSPEPIYKEIGENSIAITEHFTKDIDILRGRFCVQFVFFKNDFHGMEALSWWKDRCIEWCFARFEDCKFADQKYLDFFPEKFNNVIILKNRGVGVAPWNEFQYDFSNYGEIIFNEEIVDIVFYHYHGAKIDLKNSNLILKNMTYDLNRNSRINIYMPYLKLLKNVCNEYLNENVFDVRIESRTLLHQLFSRIKNRLSKVRIVQYVYFNILKIRYNGYDNLK